MSAPTRANGPNVSVNGRPVDLTAGPRAVLRLLNRVLGDERFGSARDNAWAAICADRERAEERAEVARLLANYRRS